MRKSESRGIFFKNILYVLVFIAVTVSVAYTIYSLTCHIIKKLTAEEEADESYEENKDDTDILKVYEDEAEADDYPIIEIEAAYDLPA